MFFSKNIVCLKAAKENEKKSLSICSTVKMPNGCHLKFNLAFFATLETNDKVLKRENFNKWSRMYQMFENPICCPTMQPNNAFNKINSGEKKFGKN